MTLVASERICSTRGCPSPTISWNAREYRKSPTSTAAALPNVALAVAWPRRSDDSSTTSSCSSVAVWIISTTAASVNLAGPSTPQARADRMVSAGRRRLPPLLMMYSATCRTSGTSEASAARSAWSTSTMSGASSVFRRSLFKGGPAAVRDGGCAPAVGGVGRPRGQGGRQGGVRRAAARAAKPCGKVGKVSEAGRIVTEGEARTLFWGKAERRAETPTGEPGGRSGAGFARPGGPGPGSRPGALTAAWLND